MISVTCIKLWFAKVSEPAFTIEVYLCNWTSATVCSLWTGCVCFSKFLLLMNNPNTTQVCENWSGFTFFNGLFMRMLLCWCGENILLNSKFVVDAVEQSSGDDIEITDVHLAWLELLSLLCGQSLQYFLYATNWWHLRKIGSLINELFLVKLATYTNIRIWVITYNSVLCLLCVWGYIPLLWEGYTGAENDVVSRIFECWFTWVPPLTSRRYWFISVTWIISYCHQVDRFTWKKVVGSPRQSKSSRREKAE